MVLFLPQLLSLLAGAASGIGSQVLQGIGAAAGGAGGLLKGFATGAAEGGLTGAVGGALQGGVKGAQGGFQQVSNIFENPIEGPPAAFMSSEGVKINLPSGLKPHEINEIRESYGAPPIAKDGFRSGGSKVVTRLPGDSTASIDDPEIDTGGLFSGIQKGVDFLRDPSSVVPGETGELLTKIMELNARRPELPGPTETLLPPPEQPTPTTPALGLGSSQIAPVPPVSFGGGGRSESSRTASSPTSARAEQLASLDEIIARLRLGGISGLGRRA